MRRAGLLLVLLALFPASGASAAPAPAISVSAASGPAPLTVRFTADAAVVDPAPAIVSYAWSFGDGTTGAGQSVAHRFPRAGSFTVVLTVTDALGGTATATTRIEAQALRLRLAPGCGRVRSADDRPRRARPCSGRSRRGHRAALVRGLGEDRGGENRLGRPFQRSTSSGQDRRPARADRRDPLGARAADGRARAEGAGRRRRRIRRRTAGRPRPTGDAVVVHGHRPSRGQGGRPDARPSRRQADGADARRRRVRRQDRAGRRHAHRAASGHRQDAFVRVDRPRCRRAPHAPRRAARPRSGAVGRLRLRTRRQRRRVPEGARPRPHRHRRRDDVARTRPGRGPAPRYRGAGTHIEVSQEPPDPDDRPGTARPSGTSRSLPAPAGSRRSATTGSCGRRSRRRPGSARRSSTGR